MPATKPHGGPCWQWSPGKWNPVFLLLGADHGITQPKAWFEHRCPMLQFGPYFKSRISNASTLHETYMPCAWCTLLSLYGNVDVEPGMRIERKGNRLRNTLRERWMQELITHTSAFLSGMLTATFFCVWTPKNNRPQSARGSDNRGCTVERYWIDCTIMYVQCRCTTHLYQNNRRPCGIDIVPMAAVAVGAPPWNGIFPPKVNTTALTKVATTKTLMVAHWYMASSSI